MDVEKIPRPTNNSTTLQTYKTDIGSPDFPTTVPGAAADYVVEDVGSCSPRHVRVAISSLTKSPQRVR